MENVNYKEMLKMVINNGENEMEKFVAQDLLDFVDIDNEDIEELNEDIKDRMIEILNYGCISGTVSSMIYYSDTEKFFDKYSTEILELLEELREEMGEFPLNSKIEINKNNLAWLGYEESIKKLMNELEIEY